MRESCADRSLPAPFDRDFASDPYRILGAFRSACPIAEVMTPTGRRALLITRADDVRTGFLDTRLVIATASGPGPAAERYPPDRRGRSSRRAIDMTLMNQDQASHARMRRLASASLTPGRMEALRPHMTALACDLLGRLPQAAAECGREIDFIEAFARPFTFAVLCDLFGIPHGDRSELRCWMTAVFNRSQRSAEQVKRSTDGIDALVGRLVRRRQADPGDDLISAIVNKSKITGSASEFEVMSLCAMLLLAGFDSSIQSISMSVLGLLTQPGILDRLRKDPSSIPHAVDEFLRWDTPGPFGTPRIAVTELRIGGTQVPAGSTVLLAIAAANHDSDYYPGPERLQLDRQAPGLPAGRDGHARRHFSFGLGRHYCLGAPLARLELEVALTEFVRHLPAIRLAIPSHQLSWRGNHTHRRLSSLPVHVGPI